MSKANGTGAPAGENGREPIFLLPPVVMVMTGLLIAIHVAASFALDRYGTEQLTIWFAFVPWRLVAPDQLPGGLWPLLWTPFSHAFLHGSWEHLLLNTAWFVVFGTPVARRYGTVEFLIIFLVGAAIGALAFLATTWGQVQFLIGASGGVAALTGAAVRFMFQPVIVARDPATGEQRVLGRKLASWRELVTQTRPRTFILFWVIINAAVPLLPMLGGGEMAIAWQAHLGGFAAGLVLAGVLDGLARRRFEAQRGQSA